MSTKRLFFVVGLISLVVTSLSGTVFADTKQFVVNSVLDTADVKVGDGVCRTAESVCTLRAAIEEANKETKSTQVGISFAGLDNGTQTIVLTSALPALQRSIFIDGYTKKDSRENTAKSPLPFDGAIGVAIDGSKVTSQDGLVVAANDIRIRGIALWGFSGSSSAIYIDANNAVIEGNYVGLTGSGSMTAETKTYNAIYVSDKAVGARIGGLRASERNIFASTASLAGAVVELRGQKPELYGNYIGVKQDGKSASSCGTGVIVAGTGALIGSGAEGAENVISSCSSYQMLVTGAKARIQGNRIGTDYTGRKSADLVNGVGILFQDGAAQNMFGGVNPGDGNIVAGVSGIGVGVLKNQDTMTPTQNAILGNAIFAVSPKTAFGQVNNSTGIDYFVVGERDTAGLPTKYLYTGPTPNDSGDIDTGPNDFMNEPVLLSARQNGDSLDIDFTLDTADSQQNLYRVEFFLNEDAGGNTHGPGELLIGYVTQNPGQNKRATLRLPSGTSAIGRKISATATAVNGSSNTLADFGSTSEFAKNIVVSDRTPVQAGINFFSQATLALQIVIGAITLLIAATLWYIQRDYRKHKQPLVQVDPYISYTPWHHLRVVVWPRLRYRVQSLLPKRRKPTVLPLRPKQ